MDLKVSLTGSVFDIEIDPKLDDLQLESEMKQEVFTQVIEAFDMRIADDIDFPNFFSNQRDSMNSDDPTDEYRRLVDAESILQSIPEIDSDSIEVELVDSKIQASFSLKSGEVIKRLL
jgi:hypothetical protein